MTLQMTHTGDATFDLTACRSEWLVLATCMGHPQVNTDDINKMQHIKPHWEIQSIFTSQIHDAIQMQSYN
jgi:hypothetical protein